LSGNGAVAAVAAYVGLAVREGVDGQLAVVAALAAQLAARLLGEALQFGASEELALTFRLVSLAVQRRAESAHQPGYVGAYDLDAHLVFKRAQHGLVVERAALHHYLARAPRA